MGIYKAPGGRDELLRGHIASMRSYADQLDAGKSPLLLRAKVVERIRKCAAEVERAHVIIVRREETFRVVPKAGTSLPLPKSA